MLTIIAKYINGHIESYKVKRYANGKLKAIKDQKYYGVLKSINSY